MAFITAIPIRSTPFHSFKPRSSTTTRHPTVHIRCPTTSTLHHPTTKAPTKTTSPPPQPQQEQEQKQKREQEQEQDIFKLTPELLTLTITLTLLTLPFLPSEPLQQAISNFITGPHLPITTIIFFSSLIQALTGFGFAIIAVATLTNLPWIANSSVLQSIQPIAATLGALTAWILLVPELKYVKWSNVAPLLISSTLLTPLGLILSNVESTVLLKLLGAVITGYVMYTTTGIKLPKFVASSQGAWILGGLAGVFGGMFDITGPALVIYGNAKGWVEDFRRNVLTVISINSTIVVVADLFTGRLQDFYYWDFVTWAFPSVIAGIVLGKYMAKRLDPEGFKRLVLGTCFCVGVKMMLF